MTNSELILGIATLVLPVLTYFAGVHREKRRQEHEQSETRIRRVSDEYIRKARARNTMGLHGLIKAGVGTLQNDREIREVCDRVVRHGEETPLGKSKELLEGVDLYRFFEVARDCGYDFIDTGKPEDVVEKLKGFDRPDIGKR